MQRFENFMERMLEGSFTRLFRSSVQPAEVARRIERAMENNVTVSIGRQYAPNSFQVRLHPDDYRAFEPYRARLEREMAAFVRETAAERGWELLTAPHVVISPNGELSRHAIEVEARLVDQPDRASAESDGGGYQPTMAMPIQRRPVHPPTVGGGSAPRPPPRPPAQPPATLRLPNGSAVAIAAPLFGLGRELDNDLVIEDSRVSRHHAQIVYGHNHYALRDLTSTNGTFLNDRPVDTAVLSSGDRISLGGYEVQITL